MVTATKSHSDFFYRTPAALAMIVPMLLIFAAGTLHVTRCHLVT